MAGNVQPMVAAHKDAARADFARRLNQLLDEDDVPKRGRPSFLAKQHKVSIEAARKWLAGLSMPDQTNLAIMATKRQVNVTWLQSGIGPKKIGVVSTSDIPPHRLALLQAYGSLPPETRRPIRALIESLAQSLNPKYQAWEQDMRERNNHRERVSVTMAPEAKKPGKKR